MYPLTRLARLTLVAGCSLWLMSCATLNVNSYTERGADLRQYHTYAWGPDDAQATGDARLDNNPFFHERVKAEVEKQLAAKGFERTTGAPDVVIHYHASMRQRIDVNEIDRERGYCTSDDCRPYVYEAGTLLVDLVDTHTNKIVWRGWAEDSMDGVIDRQQLMEERVDDLVTRIMQQLPPRL